MTIKPQYFRFIDWTVYKDSKFFYKEILSIYKSLPKEHKFGLGDQILRSGLSISLNIAEGSGKHSDKDFNHFLNISLGSLFETIAALDIMVENGLLDKDKFEKLLIVGTSISNQLGGFKKKLA
jgi:four helix bundle protein